MLSLFSHLPYYWTEGAIRYLEGLRNGLTEPFPLREDPPPVTPYHVIYEGGKVRLRYYRAAGESTSTPLLLVYALIKRPYILDLLPGKSVVQSLLKQGIALYLTDWLSGGAERGRPRVSEPVSKYCPSPVAGADGDGGRGGPESRGNDEAVLKRGSVKKRYRRIQGTGCLACRSAYPDDAAHPFSVRR